jgi:putative glycerol-1-phosphate prenyltransferase
MVLNKFVEDSKKGIKSLAVLIDPDDVDETGLIELVKIALECKANYFFIGGSLVASGEIGSVVEYIKSCCEVPVVLFPGNAIQIHAGADAI